jgi:gamma-glutamyltranspeptidase/glutathione hydrolase
MVVSGSKLASDVGVEILKKGGNAIDAAVAVGFALAVTYPYAGNIGGGGFMVIHLKNGKNTTIDFREKAPASSHRNMYQDQNGVFVPELSQEGTTSAGVPGSVAGMIYALNKYGNLSLSDVISPAIELAENGWIIDHKTAELFDKYFSDFKKYPSSLKVFSNSRKPYTEGQNFKQPDLAETLEKIKDDGLDGFYKGETANLIVRQIKLMDGYITLEDLANYKAVERKPVEGTYRGNKIVSMAPPSSGGIALIELFNILENYTFDRTDFGSSGYIHKLVEAMKYVYADRTYNLGDPDFYPVPVDKLTSKKYANSIYKQIKSDNNKAVPSEIIKPWKPVNGKECTETTHYSVYDEYGNAVSTTTTINSGFGSKIVVDGAGFLLNNEMDDFSSKPGVPNQYGLLGSEANSIQPEKRMLSSMTPTIVLKNDRPYIIVGSPGGSTIITTVLQVIMNCIDFRMNISQAIDAPRIHHQWYPDEIYSENFSLNKDTAEKLMKMGYLLANFNKEAKILGVAEGIMIDHQNGVVYGASDPRGSGSAEGY